MANSEDYLDELLSSLSDVRQDIDKKAREVEDNRKRREIIRSAVAPDDDFLSAKGLDGYEPTFKKSRPNLGRALSEVDFLREFEDELNNEDEDDEFIKSFEKELFDEGDDFDFGVADEDIVPNPELGEIDDSEDSSFDASLKSSEELASAVDSAANDFIDSAISEEPQESLENILLNAEAIVNQDVSEEDLVEIDNLEEVDGLEEIDNLEEIGDLEEINDLESLEESGEMIPQDLSESETAEATGNDANENATTIDSAEEIAPVDNAFDDGADDGNTESSSEEGKGSDDTTEEASNTEAKESADDALESATETAHNNDEEAPLLDENSEEVDLMDLLATDEELGDIGELLESDENSETLEEAEEAFEEAAENAAAGSEEGAEGASEDKSGEKASVDSKEDGEKKNPIAGIISKIKGIISKVAGDDDEDVDPVEKEIAEKDAADKKAAKEAAKAEKKAAKEAAKKEKAKQPKKEKKKPAPKPPKPKKEKAPDNSPKIPGKVILLFFVFAVSTVAFAVITQKILASSITKNAANTAYNTGDYVTAYMNFSEMKRDEEEEEMFKKSRILADLQKRNDEYDMLMRAEKYSLALDSLVTGIVRYEENESEAEELGISSEHNALYEQLVTKLRDQFGIAPEEAIDQYKLGRERYSIWVDKQVEDY